MNEKNVHHHFHDNGITLRQDGGASSSCTGVVATAGVGDEQVPAMVG